MVRKIVVLGLMMVMICSAVSQAELIGYWSLDEGSGTTAADASEFGHDVTIDPEDEDVVSWTDEGYQSGALSFSTVFTGYTYVEASITEGLLDMEEVTLAFWMNMPEDYQAWGIVMDLISADYDYSLEATDAGVLYMYDPWFGDDSSVMNDDEWHHVALTSDGDEIVIYIDGEEGATSETSLSDEIVTVRIGGPREYVSVWASFTGMLDEVVVYNQPLDADAIADLYENGMATDPQASKPSPSNGQDDVVPQTALSWTAVETAESHNVYLGTDADVVSAATVDNPLDVLVSKEQGDSSYQPTSLELGQTYYWRVDEVNEDDSILVGNLWSFTVEPVAFVLDGNEISATASSYTEGNGPEETLNESGLDVNDLHSREAEEMWISSEDDEGPVWIQYDFNGVYTLYTMEVWNSNQAYENILGFGIQEATIEVYTEEAGWTTLFDSVTLDQAAGADKVAVTSTVDMQQAQASAVRITAVSSWPGVNSTQYSLSEVRFSYIPTAARLPEPDDGETDVAVDEGLAWRSGRFAASHEVYFGTDANDLNLVGTVSGPSFDLSDEGVVYDETYYWRVDEVNEADAVSRYEGDVWSFSTEECLVLEDFEDYDDECCRIYWYWQDGAGYSENDDCGMSAYNGNGSSSSCYVGYMNSENGTFGEVGTVAVGTQSMPFEYNNSGSVKYSEAQAREGLLPTDWTLGGAAWLSLYFHGLTTNNGGELYVKINGSTVAHEASLNSMIWSRCLIDLSTFDVDLSDVESFAIGVSGSGAEGVIYIDEIALYSVAPVIAEATDPGLDNLVAYWAMDDGSGDTVTDSVGGLNGTIEGNPSWVDGFIGGAMEFDGSDDYVDCTADTAFDLTESMTLCAWVNCADAGNSEHNPFVGKGDTAYAIKHSSGNSLQFFVYEDGSWYTASCEVTDGFNDTWHHVAGTFDGSQVKLYVDGMLRGTTDHDGGISTNTYEVNLGRNSEETDRIYEGILDDVRLYDSALTEGEIRFLAGDE